MKVQYKILPGEVNKPAYVYWDDFLTDAELDTLQHIARRSEQVARVGSMEGQVEDSRVRRTRVTWVSVNTDTMWIFDKLSAVISGLNSKFYNFDIDGFGENLQFTNYTDQEQGEYSWHIDAGGPGDMVRKMSVVVQLSEPGEYAGGDLQIIHGDLNPLTVDKKRGRLVMFPSYTLHRVTPVTAGSRQTLVAWLCGKPLR